MPIGRTTAVGYKRFPTQTKSIGSAPCQLSSRYRRSIPVNAKRVERIWRREGLKVPQKQPKRGRLWLNDGSCIRLRPEHPNHVWSYDFVEGRTHNGRKFRMLNIIDEFEIAPSRSLPPLEFCRGTSPSQAANWRPEVK